MSTKRSYHVVCGQWFGRGAGVHGPRAAGPGPTGGGAGRRTGGGKGGLWSGGSGGIGRLVRVVLEGTGGAARGECVERVGRVGRFGQVAQRGPMVWGVGRQRGGSVVSCGEPRGEV